MYFKPKHPRDILLRGLHRYNLRMCHEIQMRKGGAEVRPIDVGLACGFGEEETVATGTKDVDGVVAG